MYDLRFVIYDWEARGNHVPGATRVQGAKQAEGQSCGSNVTVHTFPATPYGVTTSRNALQNEAKWLGTGAKAQRRRGKETGAAKQSQIAGACGRLWRLTFGTERSYEGGIRARRRVKKQSQSGDCRPEAVDRRGSRHGEKTKPNSALGQSSFINH
jgi:hypothetical protein